MADYISREAALQLAYWHGEKATVDNPNPDGVDAVDVSDIEAMPAAGVAQVVHGEWLRSDDDWNSLTTIQCSICGEEWCFETDDDVSLLNYKHCPNCGARMDGGSGA